MYGSERVGAFEAGKEGTIVPDVRSDGKSVRFCPGVAGVHHRQFIEAAKRGAGEILLTSMDADGTCGGYDLELTRTVSEAVGIPVIASGGAGELQHLADVLREGRADAVLAASIFHFGKHTVAEAKDHLASQGLPVRKRFDD